MFLLGIAVSVSGFGADFKLPEKFLVFDPLRMYSTKVSVVPRIAPTQFSRFKTRMDICAHIRVITPPPDLDPGIALPESNYSQSKMPVLKAPPSCQSKGR